MIKFKLIIVENMETCKRGEDDKANKLMEKYQDVSRKKKRISSYFKEIEQIRGEVSDTSELKKNKQDRLKEIYKKMTDLCRDYVEEIKEKHKE